MVVLYNENTNLGKILISDDTTISIVLLAIIFSVMYDDYFQITNVLNVMHPVLINFDIELYTYITLKL